MVYTCLISTTVDFTHVNWVQWLGAEQRVGDTGGYNGAGLGVSALGLSHTPLLHIAWEGAECVDRQGSREEEVCP